MALKKYAIQAKDKPTVIDSEKPTVQRNSAVTSNINDGEIFLKNLKSGEFFRLRWSKSDKKRARYLPPGDYRVRGFRIVQGDWIVSSSAGARKVHCTPQKALKVEIDATVHVGLKARVSDGTVQLAMSMVSGEKSGLSIYLKGIRIPVPFKIEDKDGKSLAMGSMAYG